MGVAEPSRLSISSLPLQISFVGGGYGATGVIEIVYERDSHSGMDAQ